jgi:hypothetical protein
MRYKNQLKKGDISLIIVILISGIMLSLLIPLSQKVTVEGNISRENLMSQQAIQAAKVGLEDWKYNLNRDDGNTINIFDIPLTETKNWPNSKTQLIPSPYTPKLTSDKAWIVLDGNTPGNRVLYKVEYEAPNPPNSAKITATGRVEKGGLTIDRTLEEEFNLTCDKPVSFTGINSRFSFAGGWGKQVFVLDRSIGITAPWNDFMFNNAISFRISNAKNAVDSASTTFFAPGAGNYIVKAAADNAPDDASTGMGGQSSLIIDGKNVKVGTISQPQDSTIYINGPKTVTISMTIGNGIEGGDDFLSNPMGMAFTITANNLTTCK